MSKILVIAEKPSAGADIAKVLGCTDKKQGYIEGDKYIVTWAIGHLVGLKYPEEHDENLKKWSLDPLPFNFPIKESLKILPDTSKQFTVIKNLIQRNDVSELVNAGDAGREGYLIQEWIYRLAGNKKPKKVLWASSLTDEAIKKAFENLKEPEEFNSLLDEAEARAIGDFNFGINYSRALTLTLGDGNVMLRYGRCQTPLLNLIVQRDLEIENFISKPYKNIEILLKDTAKATLVDDGLERLNFFDNSEAMKVVDELSKGERKVEVVDYKANEKESTAPMLLNLAALQKQAANMYQYSPDKTLSIAQTLYEKYKVLSYPRTDSRALSNDIYNEIKEHINSCKFGVFEKLVSAIDLTSIKADKKYFNDLKVTDHHALIPTINSNMESEYSKMSDEEKNILDIVVKAFISIFYPAYKYKVIEIVTKKSGYKFLTKGKQVLEFGYKQVLNYEEDKNSPDSEETEEANIDTLGNIKIGDILDITEINALDRKTKAPAQYTMSGIISLMEKKGVGTSATRADIIKKLMDPKSTYIELKKGKYASTELGRKYIFAIPEVLKDPELTSKFEERLKAINEGKLSKESFLQEIYDEQVKIIEELKSTGKVDLGIDKQESKFKCPMCGKNIIENSKAFSCGERCGFVIWKKISGKTINEKIVEQLLIKGKTKTKIKGFVNKDGTGKFDAYLALSDGKVNIIRWES